MCSNEIVIHGYGDKKSVFRGVKSILFTYDKLLVWVEDRVQALDTKGCIFFVRCEGIIDNVVPPKDGSLDSNNTPSGENEVYYMEIYGVVPELSFEDCSIPVSLSLNDKKKPFNKAINNNMSDSNLFLTSMKTVLSSYDTVYSDKSMKFDEASDYLSNMLDSVERASNTFCACTFMPILIPILEVLKKLLYKARLNPSKKVGSAWINNLRLKYLIGKFRNDSQFIKLETGGV